MDESVSSVPVSRKMEQIGASATIGKAVKIVG